ncbi:MAG: type II secretion system protein GspK [Candidatus Brocadiia bacterium]
MRNRPDRAGFALVAVLLLTAVLGLLAAQMAVSTLTDLELSQARARRRRLRLALDSATDLARALLATDWADAAEPDSLHDLWASGPMRVRIREASVTLAVRDENARISLPHVIASRRPEDERDLRKKLRHFVREASQVLGPSEEAIRRWIVEHQFRLGLPEEMAAEPLFEVPAEPAADEEPPGRFLTAWTDGSLNVNTAPRECLEFIWGEEADRFLDALIERREEEPFRKAQEVFSLPDASRLLRLPPGVRLTTHSPVLTLELEARLGPARFCRRVVLRRDRPGVPILMRLDVPEVELTGEVREISPGEFVESERRDAEDG